MLMSHGGSLQTHEKRGISRSQVACKPRCSKAEGPPNEAPATPRGNFFCNAHIDYVCNVGGELNSQMG